MQKQLLDVKLPRISQKSAKLRNLDYSLTLVFDMETEDLKFERRVGEMIVPHTEDQ